MNVIKALKQRHSTRAFLDRPVSREQVRRLLDAARQAPSGANTQPWQVAVVTGKTRTRLQQALRDAYDSGVPAEMDYQYYPRQWREPYASRRNACAMQLYQALEIRREDRARRRSQWMANYRAFDAPVVMLFFLERGFEAGSYIDYGLFLQSVMLAALDQGLATCPQAALGEYPGIVKELLDYPRDSVLICGMALGYEDSKAPVNGYRTPRAEVGEFTRFFD